MKNYYIKPRSKHENMETGFRVDLEVPKANSEADKAIREWMIAAIKDDAFPARTQY